MNEFEIIVLAVATLIAAIVSAIALALRTPEIGDNISLAAEFPEDRDIALEDLDIRELKAVNMDDRTIGRIDI